MSKIKNKLILILRKKRTLLWLSPDANIEEYRSSFWELFTVVCFYLVLPIGIIFINALYNYGPSKQIIQFVFSFIKDGLPLFSLSHIATAYLVLNKYNTKGEHFSGMTSYLGANLVIVVVSTLSLSAHHSNLIKDYNITYYMIIMLIIYLLSIYVNFAAMLNQNYLNRDKNNLKNKQDFIERKKDEEIEDKSGISALEEKFRSIGIFTKNGE